jgi:hypothetical protein
MERREKSGESIFDFCVCFHFFNVFFFGFGVLIVSDKGGNEGERESE